MKIMINILLSNNLISLNEISLESYLNGNVWNLLLNFFIGLVGAFVGGLITYVFNKRKLRQEQKMRSEDIIGNAIQETLLLIRDLELECLVWEVYNIQEKLKNVSVYEDYWEDGAKYVAFFSDWKLYLNFENKINSIRIEKEKYVDCEIKAYLVFIQKYLRQLGVFMKSFNNEKLLPALGTIFICDIEKWQIKFDKALIRKMNSHKYKLESHSTKKYQKKRKKIVEKTWKHTLLNLLISERPTNRKEKEVLYKLQLFIKDINNNQDKYIQE